MCVITWLFSCPEVAELLRTSAASNGNPHPAVKSLVVDLAMRVVNLVNRYNYWIGSSEFFFTLVIPMTILATFDLLYVRKRFVFL